MSEMPETAWLEDEFGEGDQYVVSFGLWDCRNAWGYPHPYIRKDIHDAVVAERDAALARIEELEAELISSVVGPKYQARIAELEAQLLATCQRETATQKRHDAVLDKKNE